MPVLAIIWTFLKGVSLRVWKWVAVVGGVLLACLYLFTAGKRAARQQIANTNSKLLSRQFQESMKGPKTKKELADSVEEDGL